MGLYGKAPVKKPLITKKYIKAKYDFGLKHQSQTVDDWKMFCFLMKQNRIKEVVMERFRHGEDRMNL